MLQLRPESDSGKPRLMDTSTLRISTPMPNFIVAIMIKASGFSANERTACALDSAHEPPQVCCETMAEVNGGAINDGLLPGARYPCKIGEFMAIQSMQEGAECQLEVCALTRSTQRLVLPNSQLIHHSALNLHNGRRCQCQDRLHGITTWASSTTYSARLSRKVRVRRMRSNCGEILAFLGRSLDIVDIECHGCNTKPFHFIYLY